MDQPLQLVQPAAPLMPFGEAPIGTNLAGNIVIGRRKDNSMALEFRLPSGVPVNPADPAHLFGLFVVNNAQQLLGLAMQTYREAEAAQRAQQDERAAAVNLQGA